MPAWITPAVVVHVGAGVCWLLASTGVVALRRTALWLLALQMTAALATVFAGIELWHERHAGPQGPMEHLLTVGTFCALIALGLQVPLAVPALIGGADRRLEPAGLVVAWLGLIALALAAMAMVASRYG